MKDRKTVLHTCQTTCGWRVADVRPRPTIPAQWQSVGAVSVCKTASRLYQTSWLRAQENCCRVVCVLVRWVSVQFVSCYIVVGPTETALICWRNSLGTRVCASGVPRNFVRVGGGVQQIQLGTEDRQKVDLGTVAPLVVGYGGSCNFVREISFHIVKCS